MASKVIIDIIANDKASGVTSGIAGSLGKLGVALAAIATAGAAAFLALGKEAVLAAGRVSEMNIVLDVLAKNAGLSFDAVKQQVQGIKDMGIETAVAQKITADFIKNNLDLTKSTDLARVAQDAAVLSMSNSSETLNDIVHAITTLNPEILRNRGIVVDSQAAYKKYAKQLGITEGEMTTFQKQQALLNEVLEEGEKIAGAYEGAMQAWQKQLRSFPRYFDDILVAAGMPFQNALDRSATAVSGLLKSIAPMLMEGGALYPLLLKLADGAEEMADSFVKFVESIDIENIAKGFAKLADMDLVELSEAFRDMMDNVDWAGISQDLIDGINSIDWAAAGAQVREASINVFEGIKIAADEIDWGGIAAAAWLGFKDFSAALGGAEDWQEVKDTWASNFDQLKEITSNKLFQLGTAAQLASLVAGQSTAASFGLALAQGARQIQAAVASWLPEIESELIKIKEVFKTQFNQMIQAALNIVLGMGMRLVAALQMLMQMLQNAIKPIRIIVSLPDFATLAAKALAGMQMLNNALSGGSAGGKYKPPRPSTNTGGGTGSGGNIGFAKGGIATGSKSGYTATLHGTEAIIPLDGGNVPVQLLGGSGMTVNLTYAPMFSTVDAYELQERLAPFIERGIRDVQRGTA